MRVAELLSVLDENKGVKAYCTDQYGRSFEEIYDGRNSISPAINDFIVEYVCPHEDFLFIGCCHEKW